MASYYDGSYGLVGSSVPGRTDRHNVDLPTGSYVLPADVVSGLGEGNSMAGASLIDKWLSSGPYGTKYTPVKSGNTIPHSPSGYASADGSYQLHNMASQVAPDQYAKGGTHKERVPAVIAGGEFIVPPEVIARHPGLGGARDRKLTPDEFRKYLDKGHKILDKFVLQTRREHIKTLKKLPPPVK